MGTLQHSCAKVCGTQWHKNTLYPQKTSHQCPTFELSLTCQIVIDFQNFCIAAERRHTVWMLRDAVDRSNFQTWAAVTGKARSLIVDSRVRRTTSNMPVDNIFVILNKHKPNNWTCVHNWLHCHICILTDTRLHTQWYQHKMLNMKLQLNFLSHAS